MNDTFIEKLLKNCSFKDKGAISILEKDSEKTVYLFNMGTGKGVMTCFHVFPGIELIYNNFNSFDTLEYVPDILEDKEIIEISHCNKGRFECYLDTDRFDYLGEGDLSANLINSQKIISDFPLGYYEGLELVLIKDLAQESLSNFIGEDFDLDYLFNKIKNNNGYIVIRAKEEINHVISELYNVDERIRNSYFKLKIVELLLFFKIANFDDEISNRTYFSLKQVEIIKHIKEELSNDLILDVTLDDLSKRYGISKTTIKNCFKAVMVNLFLHGGRSINYRWLVIY